MSFGIESTLRTLLKPNDTPVAAALSAYRQRYWYDPGFDKVAAVSQSIAGELFDIGVNMGPAVATEFLIQTLNALNRQQMDYADICFPPQAPVALKVYLTKCGHVDGEHVFLKALNCLQGARYIRRAEYIPQHKEDYLYNWLSNRVSLG